MWRLGFVYGFVHGFVRGFACRLACGIALLAGTFGPSSASASTAVVGQTAVALSAAYDSLDAVQMRQQRAGDFAGALATSREIERVMQTHPAARPWRRQAAKLQVSAMETVLTLPRRAQRDLERATALEMETYELQGAAEWAKASEAAAEAQRLRQSWFGPKNMETLRALVLLAISQYYEGNSEAAEAAFRETIAGAQETLGADDPWTARAESQLATVLTDHGRFVEARALMNHALAVSRRSYDESSGEPAVDLNISGILLHNMGEVDSALVMFEAALDWMERSVGIENVGAAMLIHNVGITRLGRGDLAGAEEWLRRACAIRGRVLPPEHPQLASSMRALGSVLVEQGDAVLGEAMHREAWTRLRQASGPEDPSVAGAAQDLASDLLDRGDHAEAETLAREVLAARERSHGLASGDYADALSLLSRVLLAEGKTNEAREARQRALGIQTDLTGAQSFEAALFRRDLATLERAAGQTARAESLLQAACPAFEGAGERGRRDLAGAYLVRGLLARESGDDARAEKNLRRALELRREVEGAEGVDFLEAEVELGRFLLAQGREREAEPLLTEAAPVFEEVRVRFALGAKRANLQHSPYPLLALAALRRGDHDAAWRAAERSLARSTADLFSVEEADAEFGSLRDRADSLRLRITLLESDQDALTRAVAAAAPSDRADRQRVLDERRLELSTTQVAWSRTWRDLEAASALGSNETLSLSEAAGALSPRSAMVGWLDVPLGPTQAESWVYVLRPDGVVAFERCDPEAATAENEVKDFRSALASGRLMLSGGETQALEAAAERLYQARIAPIAPTITTADELVVLPSGRMLGLPVEALRDDRSRWLADRWTVRYAPSATIYRHLVRRAARAETDQDSALVVGDPALREGEDAPLADASSAAPSFAAPSFAEQALAWIPSLSWTRSALSGDLDSLRLLPELTGAADEVEGLRRRMHGCRVLTREQASEQSLWTLADEQALSRYRVLHFATHALVDAEDPERSALLLSQIGLPDPLAAATEGTRAFDGLVTAGEIAGEWRLDADLVTLSACATALGRESGGDGYLGLTQAFLQAGARSLLVSLWDVDDRATAIFMDAFYESWAGQSGSWLGRRRGRQQTVAGALLEARRTLREWKDSTGRRPYAHPYYWAAFVVVGAEGAAGRRLVTPSAR